MEKKPKATAAKRAGELYKLATRAMNARDWQKAVGHWNELRALRKNAVAAYDQAARALIQLDRAEEADALLQEGRRRFPKNAAIAMRHAELAEHSKDWALAVTRWEKFHAHFTGTAHSHLQYGKALVQAGQTDEAEILLINAEKQWPDEKLIAVELAEIAVHGREWPIALERWRIVRQRFEETPGACQGESEALIALGRYDEAERLLQEATTRYPRHPGLRMRHASVAMQTEAWDTACVRWEAFRQHFGNKAEALELEAESLIRADRLDKAEQLLVMAVERFANRRPLALKLAQITSQRQDWEVAIERWKSLRKRFKATVDDYKAESWAYAQSGRWEEAESLLEIAMKRWPRNKHLWLRWAEYAMSREDWETAASRWRRVCLSFPDTPKAYLRGAQAYVNQAEFELAGNLLQEAINRFPEKPELMSRLAEIDQARHMNTTSQAWLDFYTALLNDHSGTSARQYTGNEIPETAPENAERDTSDARPWKRLFRKLVHPGSFSANP